MFENIDDSMIFYYSFVLSIIIILVLAGIYYVVKFIQDSDVKIIKSIKEKMYNVINKNKYIKLDNIYHINNDETLKGIDIE
ncbi:hypothetical protein COTV038 [Cotia virus SPAn232]|uniref:Uncharacterized protein n=2 Tax=Cotia virus TaxID=39444 RepID=H6TAJ1_9POXV|nr:hypothetical protein COTV038 [Cotia virus SPAn232]AFB76928.1 hypothetical protein COTV038 [Cotia virus SPAn232]AIT70653.1 hypothetical protein [Cotia virus]